MLVFGPEKWDGDDSHRPKRKTWQAGRHGSAVIAVEKQQPGENVLVLLFSHLWLFGWHGFLLARCHTASGKWEVFLGNWLGTSLISRRNCHHERHRFLRLRCDQRRRIRGIHLERKIPTPKLDLQNFRTPC